MYVRLSFHPLFLSMIMNILVTGDIGGSMGLFVGASVITVFELFDAILHNLSKRQFLRPEKKRHTKLYQVKNAQL